MPDAVPVPPDPQRLTEEVCRACLALGFAAVGVAIAAPSANADHFDRWIAEGRHGSMDWMTEHRDQRVDIGRLLPGARSVIMVADRYASAPEASPAHAQPPHGRIAKYALGRDYHQTIKRRLHALTDHLRQRSSGALFRSFVDTAPVLEREQAARAGLGFIGKHTLLIHPTAGSYLLLGGVATTLDLVATAPHSTAPSASSSHCGTCTRCIDACPTGAITPWQVDATRCISYLTIEHEGRIDPALHPAIGDWIFGCDVCQDVCPFNSHAPHASTPSPGPPNPAYTPRPALAGGRIALSTVLGWNAEARQATLTVSAGKRASLDMIRRNAIVAAGNALGREPDAASLNTVRAISLDANEPESTRHVAQEVLARLAADAAPAQAEE